MPEPPLKGELVDKAESQTPISYDLIMTKSILYLGVGIAKENLACFLEGESFQVPNRAGGHRRLLARARRKKGLTVQLIGEATGPYGRALVEACHQAEDPITVAKSAPGARLCALPRRFGQDR